MRIIAPRRTGRDYITRPGEGASNVLEITGFAVERMRVTRHGP